MASAVDICNAALANLGDSADITSLNPPEGSVQAERCAQFFPIAVNAMLEMHEWSFATRRITLTAFTENDREDWAFKYAMPNKCLRVIDLNNTNGPKLQPDVAKKLYDYEVAIDASGNKCIYTNLDPAFCRYIMAVEPALFPTLFVVALTWKLAAMLSGPMIRGTEGAKMAQSCEQQFVLYMRQAMAIDSHQKQDYQENIPVWIRGR